MSATTVGIAPTPLRKARKGEKWGSPLTYFIALVFIALCLAPVLYIVLGGFRSNSQITSSPAGLPNPWQFQNYVDVLTGSTFWIEIGNSAIVGIVTTAVVVVLGLMVSYVLARYEFRGKGAMYALFAAGLMFPLTVAITPLYILVKDLGLTNNLAGVILPQIGFALPTTVIILVPFIKAIPVELEEAAALDGASRLGFLLPHGDAAVDPRRGDHGHPRVHRELEQLPASAVHPQRPVDVHAAARCAGVLVAVLGGHRQSAGVHLAVHDSRADLLRAVPAPDRRWTDRGGEGVRSCAARASSTTRAPYGSAVLRSNEESDESVTAAVPPLPDVSERVRALHARMTLEEKLAQLVGYWLDQNGVVAPMQSEMAAGQKSRGGALPT